MLSLCIATLRPLQAGKLDPVRGIVNMPRSQAGLRSAAMSGRAQACDTGR
jgi:hypothetical protein